MEQTFFDSFFPKVIQVANKDRGYWDENRWTIKVEKTRMHNFSYIYQGSGTLIVADQAYEVRSGCIFHFPAGLPIELTTDPRHPLHYYTVYYWPARIEWEGISLKQCMTAPSTLPFPHVFPTRDNRLEAGMHRLYRQWQELDPGMRWKCRLDFMQLLRTCEEEQGQTQLPEEAIRIYKIAEEIRHTYMNALDRRELAKQSAMSLSYFSIQFKKYMGYAPMEYVNQLRMEHAKNLLKSTKEPVSRIARNSGFEDPLYFSKRFKQEVGLSPSEYRNS